MPDVAIWNQCNNHCVMCTNSLSFQSEKESVPYAFKSIKQRWVRRAMGPEDVISFSGGEPTIHPEFFEIIHWFRAEYPKRTIVVVSNGRMFSYLQFTRNILKISNILFEVALHGYDEKSHDSVTRAPGSFRQTVQGIHHILRHKKASQELEIRIVVTKLTYKHLGKILSFVEKEFGAQKIRDIALIFIEMEGQAQDNARVVGISYEKVKKYIESAVHDWSSSFRELRLLHFPLCTIPQILWPYAWRTLREEEVTFLSRCASCLMKKYCLGIHKDYISIMGKGEFKPVRNMKKKIEKGISFYKPIKSISRG
ncbi:MAG: His-Xaa-Ser repeat-associated downstream radical SAM protein [Parcubacteria group bacterium GW2011_GWA2_46_7]|nr:MAG: His-Xaa-Ser repeat-associated downstream radical SAM protein [Parcubacteria group bacterium GW2011_GWA2_46_7]